ncbi:MAG: MFS transporter [Caldilineaceae bacterium]|nr:MFS transporter [Caldilineaceae bacterium]
MPTPAETTVTPALRWRITGTLFAVQSLFGGAMIATFIVTSIVAARLSGLESLAGLPATLVLGGRALIGYPVGWIMDHYGRRPGFVLGYLLAVIGAIWCALAIGQFSFWQFCLGAALMGMGRGISEQTRYAAAEIYAPAQRARVIGLLVWAGTIGSVGGPLLVGPTSRMAEQFGFDAQSGPFWATAVVAAVAMLLTFIFLRPDPLHISRQLGYDAQQGEADGSARPLREIFAGAPLRLAVAALVIGQLVMTLIMVITPLHMAHHQHNLEAISWVLMGHTLGMFGLAPVTGWLIDRVGRLSMIMAGGLILAVSSLMAPLATGVLFLSVALFLLGLGWNFTFIAGSSLMSSSLAPTERGRVQGFSESLVALASGAGSLGTGAAFAYGGMVLVGAIGLACSLAFMAGALWAAQGRKLATVESA